MYRNCTDLKHLLAILSQTTRYEGRVDLDGRLQAWKAGFCRSTFGCVCEGFRQFCRTKAS